MFGSWFGASFGQWYGLTIIGPVDPSDEFNYRLFAIRKGHR